jgi:4-methyl-5(b-hydroxyethyl)-thiazole monophosphate biosynthesis
MAAARAVAATRRALVAVAAGTEDIEAVTTIDVLRRAQIHVDVVAVADATDVTLARGTRIIADSTLADAIVAAAGHHYDAIVCPGGMPGAENLSGAVRMRTACGAVR